MNSQNAHTTPIGISSEAVSATVFRVTLELSRIIEQVTTSFLSMQSLSFNSLELMSNQCNSLGITVHMEVVVLM